MTDPVYFDLERTKRMLEITDAVDDTLLNQIGRGADLRMHKWLLTITEKPPAGDDITDDMRNCVSYDVCAKYLLTKKDYEGAQSWKAEREDTRIGIESGLKRGADESLVSIPRF